ncbi:acidic leucine-rich nuclear phosphoprotein 32 family member A [Tanacetum coccineum]
MQVVIHPTISGPGCYLTNTKAYFDLQPHLNDETVIKINGEDKTVGSLVRAGLQRDFVSLYSDNKCKFKDKWFNNKTVDQARHEKPPKWKARDAQWQKLVDFWSDPDRMKQLERNAANRAKNKVTTHQGSKSFAQGRHEFIRALYTPQVFLGSISTPGGPSSTSPAPSSTPLGLGNCYTPTFDPETSQSGEKDDNDSDDGNREYDVDIYDESKDYVGY